MSEPDRWTTFVAFLLQAVALIATAALVVVFFGTSGTGSPVATVIEARPSVQNPAAGDAPANAPRKQSQSTAIADARKATAD